MTVADHRAGHVAILGRPNVGKSTLLNALVGVKLAAVSPRPQTTRHRIVGIRSLPAAQLVFMDTPGIHDARSLLNRRMVDVARDTLPDADVALLMLDAEAGITRADRTLIGDIRRREVTSLVVVNKLDRVHRPAILPLLEELARLLPNAELVPVSARTGENLSELLATTARLLPLGPPLFNEEEITTASERFLVEEGVREQLFLQTAQEVPYGTTVHVDTFTDKHGQDGAPLTVVQATILVTRDSHKGIIIGRGGARLKEIGQRARLALEPVLGRKLYLELFVRVEADWADNPRRLDELGL